MGLDDVGFAGLRTRRFDHVGINGALRQPLGIPQLGRLFLEDFDEQPADDLALLFGVGHAGQRGQKPRFSVHPDHPHAEMLTERDHDLITLVQAQQASVHEHAGELVADGPVQQRRHYRGIHSARQAQQHLVVAHLRTDGGDAVLDDVAGGPQRLAAADVQHEAAQDPVTLTGVGDFGMELHAVPAFFLVGHAGDGTGRGAGDAHEVGRQRRHPVAVAHPHVQQAVTLRAGVILDGAQQLGMGVRAHLGVTEFLMIRRFHQAAELHGQGLHPIADAEQRYVQVKHDLRYTGTVGDRGGFRAAGQDDSVWMKRADCRRFSVVGIDFAIDPDLAHPAGDQLGVLGTEVENENAVKMNVAGGHDCTPLPLDGEGSGWR